MTDDLGELERRLEQATSRQGPAEESLEPETAALRAGWLALGELLEAAQPQAGPQLAPMPIPLTPRSSQRRRWLALATAVLAASVLLAITVIWSLHGTKPAAVSPSPSQEMAAGSPMPSSLPVEAVPAAPGNTEIAWDDSLDREIELAGQTILQVQQDQLASAAASGQLQYQLEQLKKDIEDSPL